MFACDRFGGFQGLPITMFVLSSVLLKVSAGDGFIDFQEFSRMLEHPQLQALFFFRTEKYPGRHLPTDGDRRTHKEKALKKIEEKTQDFLNVGIGGADVPMCMQNSLDFLKWCATWFWHGLVIIYPRQNETTI